MLQGKRGRARDRGSARTCFSLRPPAAAVVAPEPAAVLPLTGGTAFVGGSAAVALAAAEEVVGAFVTTWQPCTVGRLDAAFVAATLRLNGWMMSVNTVLLEAAWKRARTT
jgi:hypothetical protein